MPGRVHRGRTRFRCKTLLPVALLALAASIPSASFAVADVRDAHDHELTDFDARRGTVAPTAAQRALVRDLRASVSWNRFGTPQSLIRYGRHLARGVPGKTAAAAASRWIAANRGIFRLRSTAGLELRLNSPLGRRGRVLTYVQRIGGLSAAEGGMLTVVVRRANRGWNVTYVSSTVTPDTTVAGRVRLSARDALVRAARNAGLKISLGDVSRIGKGRGWSLMEAAGLDGPQRAKLVAFPTPNAGPIRAYETIATDLRDGEPVAVSSIVDAQTGKVLMRANLVDHAADNPKWDVFPASPRIGLNHYPWNYSSADIRRIWCWTPAPDCDDARMAGSPHPTRPWDTDPVTGAPTFTTFGNNALTWETWDAPAVIIGGVNFGHVLPGPNFYMPESPTRDYLYPWRNIWFETLCDPANMPGHPSQNGGNNNDLNAAVTNLFAMHNRMHDWSYHLGFTEARWNAQLVNLRPGTAAGDPLIGDTQAGARAGGAPTYAARDNANMVSFPDGTTPVTNMYLWQPLAGTFYAPCVDGAYDMPIIGHEYAHLIENRMIGKGGNRTGHHAGAMGESNGDINAMEYLQENGYVPVSGENPYSVGAYATSNKYRAIRNYGMNFPFAGGIPRPGKQLLYNSLNFSDIGYDLVGAQVHADGEIWSATNFDLRRLLLEKYGFGSRARQKECADGQRPAQDCPGNRRWIQIVYDAYLIMTPAPTMLEARNAYLAADMARFGGANQRELWRGFAWRGFGQSAFNAGPEDYQPKPAFDSPHENEATVSFRAFAKDERNAPVAANIYVGHYEGRVSPIAVANAAAVPGTPTMPDASNTDGTALFTSRTYEFVAQAPGYGNVRFRARFRPGQTRTITIRMPTNWASRHKGAVAAGDGTRHAELIDDTEATNWESTGVPVQGRQVTVQLAGGAHSLRRGQVSAYLGFGPENPVQPGPFTTQNRFTALRQFELRACSTGASSANPGCLGTNDAGWQVVYRSSPDFFPGDNPRPVAPQLLLRGFDLGHGDFHGRDDDEDRRGKSSKRATHVQLVVLNNQCTGNPHYQGEQDNDPNNPTDCRVGNIPAALPPRGNDVRAAELQVFSSRPSVSGAQLADERHDDDDQDDDDD
jgi:extracellular elastinolytic metalloproteinase